MGVDKSQRVRAAVRALSFVLWVLRDAGLPNGQLPILEIDGKVLPQSGAQLRYVGKLAGEYALVHGSDPL